MVSRTCAPLPIRSAIITTLADAEFGHVPAGRFARDGDRTGPHRRPSVGVIANNTMVMAGAITAAAADKAARFLQLCDTFGIAIVSLIDCPGYMVGPAAESQALVRRASRMLVAGAALRVPLVAVVLRRGYGLGARRRWRRQPVTSRCSPSPWPGAHLGPMGLEGAVRLGLRKELDAIADPTEREEVVRQATAAQENAKSAQRRNAVRDRRCDRPGRDPRPHCRDPAQPPRAATCRAPVGSSTPGDG